VPQLHVLAARSGQKNVQEKHSSLFGVSISDFEKTLKLELLVATLITFLF
jgi:hypothetical protein